MRVKNLDAKEKKIFKTDRGVKIIGTSDLLESYNLEGKVLLEVNGEDLYSIKDAESVDNYLSEYRRRPSILLLDKNGEKERLIFQ